MYMNKRKKRKEIKMNFFFFSTWFGYLTINAQTGAHVIFIGLFSGRVGRFREGSESVYNGNA